MNPFQRAARIFLIIFIVSTVFFVASMSLGGFSIINSALNTPAPPTQNSGNPQPTEDPNQPDHPGKNQNPSIFSNAVTVITTISTSIASFVGFLFTNNFELFIGFLFTAYWLRSYVIILLLPMGSLLYFYFVIGSSHTVWAISTGKV